MDFTDTDYSNYLGFTWERELVGMVGVGLDPNQTEFNTIGKTGGSKYLQKHSHRVGGRVNSSGHPPVPDGSVQAVNNNGEGWFAGYTEDAGTGESGNLQPYKVVAYWKRVA